MKFHQIFVFILISYHIDLSYSITEFNCAKIYGYTYCTIENASVTKENPHFTVKSNISDDISHIEFYVSVLPILTGDVCNDLPRLHTIKSYRSSIESLDSDSFENCTNLRTLELWSNKLKTIPGEMFVHLKNLTTVDFDNNEIEYIHSEAFAGMDYLKRLILKHNSLTFIHPEVFRPLKSLMELDLEGNDLFDLNVEYLLSISTNLKRIALYENIFECNRKSVILEKLKNANVTVLAPRWFSRPNCSEEAEHQGMKLAARKQLVELYPELNEIQGEFVCVVNCSAIHSE